MSSVKKCSLLWKLRSVGPSWSYLYGTMHVKDERAFGYIDQIKPFLYECDVFSAELSLDSSKENILFDAVRLPKGSDIGTFLDERQFNKIRRGIRKAFKIDLAHYRHVRPVILTSIFTESVLSQDYREGLDQFLWNCAKELNRTCIGLESLEHQIDLLKRIPVEIQIRMLRDISENTPKFRRQVEDMMHMYMRGDIYSIYKSTKKFLGSMRKWLLYERNFMMAECISSTMKEHAVFATFGAGHLAGSKGIIRLLKRKGFELLPVKLL